MIYPTLNNFYSKQNLKHHRIKKHDKRDDQVWIGSHLMTLTQERVTFLNQERKHAMYAKQSSHVSRILISTINKSMVLPQLSSVTHVQRSSQINSR